MSNVLEMKNKEFFYLQYNKLNWQNQERTKINFLVNDYIIQNIITKKTGDEIRIYDIGFGVGFFEKMLAEELKDKYKRISLRGCEPSEKNFKYFKSKDKLLKGIDLVVFNSDFLETKSDQEFDFLTAIYVFPHFESEELEKVVKKINSMLKDGGKFVLVVANEKYIEDKLKSKRDLFIERNKIEYRGKNYSEVLHYSEIPEIGTVIDYNREEKYYLDLFLSNGFELSKKKDLNDNGFICTVFVFDKENI